MLSHLDLTKKTKNKKQSVLRMVGKREITKKKDKKKKKKNGGIARTSWGNNRSSYQNSGGIRRWYKGPGYPKQGFEFCGVSEGMQADVCAGGLVKGYC